MRGPLHILATLGILSLLALPLTRAMFILGSHLHFYNDGNFSESFLLFICYPHIFFGKNDCSNLYPFIFTGSFVFFLLLNYK